MSGNAGKDFTSFGDNSQDRPAMEKSTKDLGEELDRMSKKQQADTTTAKKTAATSRTTSDTDFNDNIWTK